MQKKNRLGTKGRRHGWLRRRRKEKGARHTLLGAQNHALGYLNMPKSACTTIKNILFFLHNGDWYPDPLHIHKAIKQGSAVLNGESYLQHREAARIAGKRWLNFTFVRDPGKRVYSAFVEKIWAEGPYSFPRIRESLASQGALTLRPLNAEGQAPPKEEVASNFRCFLDFIADNLSHKTPFQANPHWCVQSKRIRQFSGPDAIDYIGRVERFSEDMSKLLSEVGYEGIDLTSQRFNEGPRPPYSLADIMDPDMAQRLWDIYAKDYEGFGYGDPRQLDKPKQNADSIKH